MVLLVGTRHLRVPPNTRRPDAPAAVCRTDRLCPELVAWNGALLEGGWGVRDHGPPLATMDGTQATET